jgi:uncharacterized phage protein (TIGR01671 family)
MREIKFRAWCGTEVSSPFMQYSEQAERLDWFFTDIGECKELMQYTGLKDKNGVEIYEGDIMTADKNSINSYIVKYVNNNFILSNRRNTLSSVLYFKEREVIGNIYENQELLERIQ